MLVDQATLSADASFSSPNEPEGLGPTEAELALAAPDAPAPKVCAPSVEPHAARRAARALEMAGAAIDSNAERGPQPELARLLLRESVVWVARALDVGDVAGYPDAVRKLGENGVLERAFGNRRSPTKELASLEAPSPPPADLAEAEQGVMKLVEFTAGRRTTLRHRWAARAALVFGALLSVALVVGYSYTHPWRAYTFRTSSVYSTFKQTGELSDVQARGLLFHTNEEDQPWVEINLLREKSVHSVVLKNRFDCCQTRGIPLVVEVRTDATNWKTVAQRDTLFDTWEASFAPIEARYVRIRSLKRTVLHLREIQIR